MIKDLLDSNNIEDIILGIRLLDRDNIYKIFNEKYENKDASYNFHKDLNLECNYNVFTDLGSFWIRRYSIFYTSDRISILTTEITLDFKT